MSRTPPRLAEPVVDYPTGDGKPVGETVTHRDNLFALIAMLRARFAGQRDVYVSGNMMMYYVRGDKRKHVSPDVFVSRGVPDVVRNYYLAWEEPRGPELVIELTSKSTRKVDLTSKFELYRDVLGVVEYFLYDPLYESLDPPLRGFRRRGDQFVPVEPVDGRLPSEVVGLHLEDGGANFLRLHDPATGLWLPTWEEVEAGWVDVKARLGEREAEIRRIEAENDQLRRELEALRRGAPPES